MLKVPFKKGEMLSYPYNEDEWIDSYIFEDTLVWERFERGRSSVVIYLKSIYDGKRYPTFISAFEKIIQRNFATRKVVMMSGPGEFMDVAVPTERTVFKGHFTFIKRGENYSISPVELSALECPGCGRRADVPLDKKYLSCCPDGNRNWIESKK